MKTAKSTMSTKKIGTKKAEKLLRQGHMLSHDEDGKVVIEKPQTPTKEKKSSYDVDHFRIGTKGSAMFALLKKGCTLEKLNEVGGKAVPGFIAGIIRKVGSWPAGREAVLKRSEDGKSIRIVSYKTVDGKKIVLNTREDKA